MLVNIAFLVLGVGTPSASIFYSLTRRKSAIYWVMASIAVSALLFAASSTSGTKEVRVATKVSEPETQAGKALVRAVQGVGDTLIKWFLLAANSYIVLRGLSLLLLASGTREAHDPNTSIRYFVGALVLVLILGAGLSANLMQTG
jgi:hypothetical protein